MLRAGGFLAAALLVCTAWLAHYSGNAVARAAGRVMQDEVTRGHFSGVVRISRRGQVIFEKAYGLADAEREKANTLSTRFRIGSISKAFTAVLVLQLEQQGRLRLTDGICDYLAECPAGWEAITLEYLLLHRSGIFNFTDLPGLDGLRATPQTREQLLARFIDQPLAFSAGERFDYSNSNYFLLALVVEKASGESYANLLRRQVLEPLGMNDTGIATDEGDPGERALGYRSDSLGELARDPPMHHSWSLGSGALYSTPRDLAKFSEALSSGQLLPRAQVERIWEARRGHYGYGWQTPDVSSHTFERRVFEHGGRVPGFVAMLKCFVDDGLTVVVLSNRLDANPVRAANSLSAVVHDRPYVSVFDRRAILLPTEVRRRLVGDYEYDGRIYSLTERDGTLYVRSGSWPEAEVRAESVRELYIPGSDGTMTVRENEAEEVTGLDAMINGQSNFARKVR